MATTALSVLGIPGKPKSFSPKTAGALDAIQFLLKGLDLTLGDFVLISAKIAEIAGCKGDLVVGTGVNGDFGTIGVGSDNQVLISDSSQPSGLKWADVSEL